MPMPRMKVIVAHLPGGISCREAEEFVDRYLDGELSAVQNLKFRLHIAMCVECQEYLSAYKTSRSLAKSSMDIDAGDVRPMPDDLVKAILASRESE